MVKINGTEFTTLLLGLEIAADGSQLSARVFIDVPDEGKIVRIHKISGIEGREILAVPQVEMVAFMEDGRVDYSNICTDEFTDCIVEAMESIDFMRRSGVDLSKIGQEEDKDGRILTDEILIRAYLEEQRKLGNFVDFDAEDLGGIIHY